MRKHLAVLAATTALIAGSFIAPPAQAAPADHLIINEVYARGGSTNQPYQTKFVELYNPTGSDITLSSGWGLGYGSGSSATVGNTCQLTGTVRAGDFYVVAVGSNGANGETIESDQTCTNNINPSGTNGSYTLLNGSTEIDLVGWGSAVRNETAVAEYPGGNSAPGAITRTGAVDTDNNAVDFTFTETPTPGTDATIEGGPVEPTDPPTTDPTDPPTTDPTDPPQGATTPIAEIQGAGGATPVAGRTVTTVGVVTAAYPTGGFRGAYIQTPGTGGEAKAAGDASDGIFVYGDAAASATIGECYTVTGTAGEYNGLTQLTNPTLTPAEGCEAVAATELASLPQTDAEKEVYEGMLVLPVGTYTITNNYALNQYGQIGLAYGDEPLFQATDVVRPGAEAIAYEEANRLKEITLDDGSSWNYMTNATAKNSPLPYLSAASPMRTGSPVTFAEPVILDYRFQWNYQPTSQVVGAEQTFLTTVNDRPAAPAEVAGDVKLASFNVLNYFDDLGAGESGCRFYADRNGDPVGANNCQVRGAYSAEAFADQEAKIVAAINKLDADVVGLQEIENSAAITYLQGQPRDKALATLVAALNEAGGNWAFAPSPTVTPPGEDVIRTAFIYNPDTIELVGPSYILLDDAFSNAREPLAQEFGVIGTDVTFVAINNHFKSKGSGVDDGTGQGNANPSREAQARALSNWANTFEAFVEKAVFLMGDFNAYTMETPLQILEAAGFENQTRGGVTEEATYQFSGRLGSLDHVFANEAAQAIVGGATVWNINGDESIAFQYSRRNYNVTDFHADDVYASSDHDPVILGILAAQPDTTAPVVEIADQSATVGTEFTLAVEATDDSLPLTYQLGEGAPAWLSIDEDGVLSGMPAEEGTVEVSVVVTDAAGNATTATFSLVVAPEPDTTGPVIEPIADRSTQVGVPFRQQVSATDESTPLIYSLTGAPSWMSIDPTGLILGTPTTVGAFTVTVNVTDSEGNVSSGTFTVIVGPAPTTEPTDDPTDDPTGEPTDEPGKYQRTAPYTLAGLHRNLNGRDWNTTCEQYSQTERCRTDIWATVVVIENGRFERKNTWTFNNLTYLPYMTREAWGTNPLARTGEWTAETDGRQWRTECDTARTGGNGCRSYSYVTVYKATPARNGGYVFSQANEWVFNNIVMFGSPELR